MPRVNVPVNSVSRAGKHLTDAGTSGDATNDHEFVNDGNTLIRVKNTNASPCTVELVIARTVDGQVPAVRTVTVAATTGDTLIGPFPVADYGSVVQFNINNATGVTVYAYSLAG